MTPYVFLPIETVSRELDGNLLIGVCAALRGATAIVGSKGSVAHYAIQVGGGHLLYKDHSPASLDLVSRLHRSGISVSALDQEGLVLDPTTYGPRRVHVRHEFFLKDIFAWGERQRDEIARYAPSLSSKIVLSGSPRADILGPAFRPYRRLLANQVMAARNHIQINLRSAAANWNPRQYGTPDYLTHLRVRGLVSSAADEARVREKIAQTRVEFQLTTELVSKIRQSFPNTLIVVRPHPDESMPAVKKAYRHIPGVTVTRHGSHLGWMESSRVCISTNCTTGVEAGLAGKHSINFDPHRQASSTNIFGATTMHAQTIPEVLEALRVAHDTLPAPRESEEIQSWIFGLGDHIAAETIVNRMLRASSPSRGPASVGFQQYRYRAVGQKKRIQSAFAGSGKYERLPVRDIRARVDCLSAAVTGSIRPQVRVEALATDMWKMHL